MLKKLLGAFTATIIVVVKALLLSVLCVASLFAISEHGFMIVPMAALFALAFYMLMEFRAAKDRKLSPGAAEAPSDTPSRETVSQP